MNDLCSNYSKSITTKDRTNDPAAKNKFSRQQEKNAIVHHEVDDIILNDNKKLIVEDEAHKNIDS